MRVLPDPQEAFDRGWRLHWASPFPHLAAPDDVPRVGVAVALLEAGDPEAALAVLTRHGRELVEVVADDAHLAGAHPRRGTRLWVPPFFAREWAERGLVVRVDATDSAAPAALPPTT